MRNRKLWKRGEYARDEAEMTTPSTSLPQVKAGSVKQEFEKQEELRRSAMRAVAALLAVPEVERSPSLVEFANQIRINADMASFYQSVQGGEGGGPAEGMETS